jgi:hypothetical protein
MLHPRPIACVFDGGVSLPESLASLIRSEGRQPDTFASTQEFLNYPQVLVRDRLVLNQRIGLAPDIYRKDGKDMPEATWEPHEKHGRLTTQSDLPDSVYAFPKRRKEPLTDAQHVRNAVARFDQVIEVSDADRALAFANIEKAAKYYGVNLGETSWHDLGIHPQKK